MEMNPYLSFKGECEAAFKLYEQCLGGQLGAIFRYAGTPMADQVPADWADKIMHGSMTIGDQTLMGGDVAPDCKAGLFTCFSHLLQTFTRLSFGYNDSSLLIR